MEEKQVAAAPGVIQPRETITNMGSNKGGKLSRNKRKGGRRGSPISLFVKGLILGEDYFKKTGQSIKR